MDEMTARGAMTGSARREQHDDSAVRTIDTVIIGGGQAGLALGYYLARAGVEYVIFDAHDRVGDAWRTRWDSLHLFTPAKFNGLPGMKFPGDRLAFPSKDEQADFLERYAARFDLRVQNGVRVDSVGRDDDGFVVRSGSHAWSAQNVVVATGGCQTPSFPGFAGELSASIQQLHSSEYRSPSQLAPGTVLVVGLGNSGAELALEASRAHPTIVAARAPAELPFPHNRVTARFVLPIIRFLGTHLLTLRTPPGRKMAAALTTIPLIRTRSADLTASGVRMVQRIAGVRDGLPVTQGGEVLDVSTVVWCTGYRDDFSWIDAPAFDDTGLPVHDRGVVAAVPGLYFLGQEFLFAIVSATLPGVGRDARHLVRTIRG